MLNEDGDALSEVDITAYIIADACRRVKGPFESNMRMSSGPFGSKSEDLVPIVEY